MFKAKDKAHNNTLYSLLVLEPLVPFNPVLAKPRCPRNGTDGVPHGFSLWCQLSTGMQSI